MDSIVTIEETRDRFPSEWVLLAEPEIDDRTRLKAGRVIFHGPARDEVYRKAAELRLPHFAVRYLGKLPEKMALVL